MERELYIYVSLMVGTQVFKVKDQPGCCQCDPSFTAHINQCTVTAGCGWLRTAQQYPASHITVSRRCLFVVCINQWLETAFNLCLPTDLNVRAETASLSVCTLGLFSSLGELNTISQRTFGATFTIRPGTRHPVSRRTPSPGKATLETRTELVSSPRPPTLPSPTQTPPTILKSSSLNIPHEPKEVRFVMRSCSARSRSPSPSGAPMHSLLPPKPFCQKPVAMWNKYDVADWLDNLNLSEHRDSFLHNEIEGSHLPALTKEDFVELGVTRVGHRMNMERALKRLLES
ncbi:SH3 and multiple ankyrin repeat domains protein 3-like isoform X1 [Callorhinchus milii]|uniref:SAM domain-containing protein n=1 Tax=Callorhinchus milii TaxID=7868 RepID=A0A4W3GZ24_CALMI|nr:SH3 and multiple ankyrin repeat domains protein 3-like isoform X1 [Callorhinchus milii]